MTFRPARAANMVVVTVLVLTSQCAAPPAHAVSPPPIDKTLLPDPASPAPPQATEQREMCTVPTTAQGGDSGTDNQLKGFDLPAVWELTRGSGQRVAVIDTGVYPHRRLPAVIPGGDYVSTGDGRQDCDGHGTLVAGIIAGTADSGDARDFSGVAPDVTLISIRQSSNKFGPVDDPSTPGFGDVGTLAMAVRTAADMGASVINISAVACAAAGSALDDRALGAALSYAVDTKDVVVVAAAGNVGGAGQCPAQNSSPDPTVVASPAWYDDYVLTVGSVGPDGRPSPFSLAGPWVDVAAPGEAVVSLSPSGDGLADALPGVDSATPISGTSYSAPVVSGLAALVRSRFPRLTARQVMARIETTAHHPPAGWDAAMGNGVVDALAALSAEAPTMTSAPAPIRAESPITPAPAPMPAQTTARDTALRGAALCLAVLTVSVAIMTALARLWRRGGPDADASVADGVAGD
jgi:membrane-anchored mycosin MYCP